MKELSAILNSVSPHSIEVRNGNSAQCDRCTLVEKPVGLGRGSV